MESGTDVEATNTRRGAWILACLLIALAACGRIVPRERADITTDDALPETPSECGAPCEGTCVAGTCFADPAPVPSGEFAMGDPTWSDVTIAQRRVDVANAYEIDLTEVTVADYATCVADKACSLPKVGEGCNWTVSGREQHPVNCVSWEQASTYCEWGEQRLCSEAEWEKAARGGCELYSACEAETWVYPWGNDAPTCERAVMAEDDAGCGLGHTAGVGTRIAGKSPYGVLDLAGNVWEWVADCYQRDYAGAPTDGSAREVCPDEPGAFKRVRRGGGYNSAAPSLRSSQRLGDTPDYTNANLGFRCCRLPGVADTDDVEGPAAESHEVVDEGLSP